jgi:hypothetical protein
VSISGPAAFRSLRRSSRWFQFVRLPAVSRGFHIFPLCAGQQARRPCVQDLRSTTAALPLPPSEFPAHGEITPPHPFSLLAKYRPTSPLSLGQAPIRLAAHKRNSASVPHHLPTYPLLRELLSRCRLILTWTAFAALTLLLAGQTRDDPDGSAPMRSTPSPFQEARPPKVKEYAHR